MCQQQNLVYHPNATLPSKTSHALAFNWKKEKHFKINQKSSLQTEPLMKNWVGSV